MRPRSSPTATVRWQSFAASSPPLRSRGVLANLPVSFLRGGRTRGAHLVQIPEGALRIALVVEVIDPEPYERYRLEIRDRERDGALVWESDRLLRHGSVLSLSLPSSLFDAGHYDLFLHGIDEAGRETRLEESYLMKVWRTKPRGSQR